MIDPLGKILALAGETEEIITAVCDIEMLSEIRGSIPVFGDRRPELYGKQPIARTDGSR